MGQQRSAHALTLRPRLTEQPLSQALPVVTAEGQRVIMVGAGVSCPTIKYLGFEVTNTTSAQNSLIKSSQMVTLKHNEVTLPCVQKAENQEYLVNIINDYHT